VTGGIKLPGVASWLSDPSTGKNTVVQGRSAFPADDQPTISETNVVHLAWDVMVGIGTLLFLLAAWYALSWLFRRDYPRLRVFLWIASAAGVLAVLALEAGWVVTEVGRQPWIVHDYLRVNQAATTNGGVWITFLTILVIYAAVGTTLVLVLRQMSRRWPEHGGIDESDVPYGPTPVTLESEPTEAPVP
jgi:cytochrome d ubiquinol oxidase subunit I